MAKKTNNTSIHIRTKEGESESMSIAKAFVTPEIQAAATIDRWEPATEVDPLVQELFAQTSEVDKGSMRRAEAMLVAQAHTLDQLFNNLARRAHGQEYMANFETMLRLAFKAQSQCRATIETLAAIKNPPVIFAKQANISGGHQQINNGGTPSPRAGENKNQQNELLMELLNETLDTGRTGETLTANTQMETVGKINGS